MLKITWFDLGLRLTPVTPGLFQSGSWSSYVKFIDPRLDEPLLGGAAGNPKQ